MLRLNSLRLMQTLTRSIKGGFAWRWPRKVLLTVCTPEDRSSVTIGVQATFPACEFEVGLYVHLVILSCHL